MVSSQLPNKAKKNQAVLETAIILIAFVIVASVFAFSLLATDAASSVKGRQVNSAGLNGDQSSVVIKDSTK